MQLVMTTSGVMAQYDPAGGFAGSEGVHRNDNALVQYPLSATMQRGYQHLGDTNLGLATTGKIEDVLGKADGYCLSLGDGGVVTLFFDPPINNQEGFDFVVFENGFSWGDNFFLELAFVEVSSDGRNYFRFPAFSDADTIQQIENLAYMQSEWYYNLAGKHQAPYGTPFDLDKLNSPDSLDLNHVSYVRVVDVVGSLQGQFATYDSRGRKINDPWPTGFESSGFDLDAVGVLSGTVGMVDRNMAHLRLSNPMKAATPGLPTNLEWHTTAGIRIDLLPGNAPLAPGLYYVLQHTSEGLLKQKICVIP